jgi:protein involved in polysaccharide export with SLBB domain
MDGKTKQGCLLVLASLIAVCAGSGCTSMMVNAIPAPQLPLALMAEPRCPHVPIDFTLLRQQPPQSYIVGPRDTLGIYIQDILGRSDEPPPVFTVNNLPGSGDPPLVVGNPVTVGDDGTIILPRIPPLRVAGLSLGQIDALIRRTYTVDHRLLPPGKEQVNVTVIRKRLHRVVVIREDVAAVPPILKPRDGTIISRRGTAITIDMPSFENDVLHALSQTGGLPGEDAHNEVWVLRGGDSSANSQVLEQLQSGADPATINVSNTSSIVRIPLSAPPGVPLPFGLSDVVLHDGDVLYVQSRTQEVYYTGGLLPGGQYMLPRDYDLDVVHAIAMAGGSPNGPAGFPLVPQFRSGSGPGNIVAPTRIIIIRKMPDGAQVKIYVDLRKALYDPRQRVLIQPGDTILAFWQPWELAANIGLNLVNFQYILPN